MRNQKPSWWRLYAIVPLMAGALLVNALYGAPGVWGEIVGVGIIVAGFGLMMYWMNANQTELWNEELARDKSRPTSGRSTRFTPMRSRSAATPRTALREPLPRTGFGSARGKRFGKMGPAKIVRDTRVPSQEESRC